MGIWQTKDPAAASATSTHTRKGGFIAGNILFALSGTAMTLLLSQGGSLLFIGVGVLLSFVVCLIIAFRFDVPKQALVSPKPLPLALGIVLAVCVALLYRAEFARTANEVIVSFLSASPFTTLTGAVRTALPNVVCAIALFALFVWFYLFSDRAVQFARRWFISSCRAERLFLLIGFALAVTAILLVYGHTTAFYGGAPYDVVYTTDSGNLISTNSFVYVNAYENDIRQPLFAVFSMPFAVLSLLLGKILFFLPNAYPTVLACVQAGLLLFGFTLLARLFGVTGADRVLFLLLLAVSYPTLLFLFTIEQYVFSVFWLFVLLYVWHERRGNRAMLFVAAAGSLLASGVLFPLLFEGKGVKKRVRTVLVAGLAFLAVFVVFARVPLLNRALQNVRDVVSFAGETVPLRDRAMQFLAFVSACFARPVAGVDRTTYLHTSYQMLTITHICWLGVAILLLAAVSAVLHRKEATMRVFSLWAAFSVFLLLLVGWGSSENGMVLYTLYFFWAFAALLYALLQRLTRRKSTLRYGIAAAGIVALLCVNVPGLLDLIRFAVIYYPAS